MKITGRTTHTTTIHGEISKAEIVAFIRQRLSLPPECLVSVFVGLDEPGAVQFLSEANGNVPATPLGFEVTIQGDVPFEAPAPDIGMLEETPALCAVGGCRFPSLAGGLCASHMSEAHRRRHNTLPSR